MNTTEILECESNSLRNFQTRMLLPNYFKIIGIALTVLSLASLFIFRFLMEGAETYIFFASRTLLVSLLVIALSRETIEDELLVNIRSQAATGAFFLGIIFAIFQPVITMIVASVIRPEKAFYEDMTVFIILWFMLVIYLSFFHLLKRVR